MRASARNVALASVPQPTLPTNHFFLLLAGVSERLGRHVYYGFEANAGEFAVLYEWALHWNKKSKFFTSQEKGRIEACKKQASAALSRRDFTVAIRTGHFVMH